VTTYAATQRADVASFEAIGAREADPTAAVGEVKEILDAIGRRPGTVSAFLVDPRGVIRASAEDGDVGAREDDLHVRAALGDGRSHAGHEVDGAEDGDNFEFVAPVNLPGGRYAFEVSYSHAQFDADLAAVRHGMLIASLIILLGGGLVFYLVGGRPLMRSHARSLLRATRDGLTDLPNQRAFQDDLDAGVASATRYQEHLALAVLDVDDFKFINDKHGHPHGDEILRRVADVLRAGRSGDRSYRTGGDEFAVLLPHTDEVGAVTVAQRLSRVLAERDVTISMGVAGLRPGQSAEALRAEADAALYETKRRGGGVVTPFDDVREVVAITTAEKRDGLRSLITDGQVTTVMQPIWDLLTETLIGYEALTRLDPVYGLSGPAEAFDVAEQTGRVHDLDVLCATNALRQAAQLPDQPRVFINLSPLTLDLDAEGNDWFATAVHDAGLSIDRVIIEVTERFGARTASVVKALHRMREQGFQLALDDVGTGNSGLEMLRLVGAEFVKIDGSIVRAAAAEPNARAVLLAMATFAQQTGSFVIAEGIEDTETLDFLSHVHEAGLSEGRLIQGGQGFGLGLPASPSRGPNPTFPAPTKPVVVT
jgi:diguanylate cyclase (GGDEF)-like protein